MMTWPSLTSPRFWLKRTWMLPTTSEGVPGRSRHLRHATCAALSFKPWSFIRIASLTVHKRRLLLLRCNAVFFLCFLSVYGQLWPCYCVTNFGSPSHQSTSARCSTSAAEQSYALIHESSTLWENLECHIARAIPDVTAAGFTHQKSPAESGFDPVRAQKNPSNPRMFRISCIAAWCFVSTSCRHRTSGWCCSISCCIVWNRLLHSNARGGQRGYKYEFSCCSAAGHGPY